MNKIYKVIWNKAKHCYVVVSELAKSRTKSPSVGRSVRGSLAAVIAAAVISGGMMFNMPSAFAADGDTPTLASESQYIAIRNEDANAVAGETKQYGNYTYTDTTVKINDKTYHYWVRDGYTITGKYDPAFTNEKNDGIVITATLKPGASDTGILKTDQIISSSIGKTVTGKDLGTVSVGKYGAVTNSGGVGANSGWNYFIQTEKNGYQDVGNPSTNIPNGFVTVDKLSKNDAGEYVYQNQVVPSDKMYSLGGKYGIFTDPTNNNKLYTGPVYGLHNEQLMTGVDENGNKYSYWGTKLDDPNASATQGALDAEIAKREQNDLTLMSDDIKEITLTGQDGSATVGLTRQDGTAVKGGLTFTSGGGNVNEGDTYIKISNEANATGIKLETGSKVIGTKTDGKLSNLNINGTDYAIPQGKTYTGGTNVAISDEGVISAIDTNTTLDEIASSRTGNKDSGYTYTVVDTAGNSVEIDDVASAAKLGEVNTQVNTNKDNISNLTTTVDGHTTSINNLNTTVEGHTTSINNLNTTVEGHTTSINNLNTTVEGHTTSITNLNTTLNGTVNTVTFNESNGEIGYTKVDGSTVVAGSVHDYNIDNATFADNKITITSKNQYGEEAGKSVEITGVAGTADIDKAKSDLTTNYTNAINESYSTISNEYKTYQATHDKYVTDGSYNSKTGTITLSGANGFNPVTITGIASDVDVTEAKSTVSEGKNITVTPTTEADGHTNYNVKLNDDIDVNDVKANSANIGGVQIADKQINIDNGTIIDSNGFHVSKEKGYTHIGAGTVDLNDRINLNGQNGTIYVENSTENKLTFDENGLTIGSGISNTVIKNSTIQSGGILINGNADAGTITGLSNKTTDYAGFATSGRAATEEQLKIVSDTANKGWNLSTNGENATNVAPGTTVDFSNTDNNIVISKDEQNNVKVDLNKDIKVDSVTADNANIGGVQIAEKQINIDNGTIIDSNGFHVSKEEGYTHIGAGTVDLNDRINLNGQNGTIYVENSPENKLIFDENGLTIGSGISNTVIKNSTIQSGGILINGNADAGTITGLSNKTTDYAGFATSGRAATEEQLKTVKEELTANDKHLVTNPGTENGHYNVSDNNSIDLKMSDGSQITIDNVAKADDLGDVNEINEDLKNKDGSHTSVVDGLNNLNNKVDNLDGRVDDIEKVAGAHTSIVNGNGITLDKGTNAAGGTEYTVGLANDFTLGDKESGNFIDVNGSGGNITASNQVVVGKGGEGNNQVVIDGNKGTVSGLTNTTWDDNTAKAVADNKNGEKTVAATQGQLGAVDTKVNNNTTMINNNTTNIQNNSNRITNLENRVGDVEERINKVGAMAAAMANLHTMGYDPAAPTEISAGLGQYKGETALAVGFFHYPNQDFMVSGSISVAGDEVMAGVGATWKIGRKSQAQLDAREAEKRIEKAAAIKRAAKDAEVRAQAQRHAQLLAEREAHHAEAAADTAAPAADAAANA